MLAEEHWSADLKEEIAALKGYFQQLIQEWDRRPAPQYLYHYTTFDTLCKILDGETIRLYDLMVMKDEREFLHPLQIVNESMQPYSDKLLLHVTSFFHGIGINLNTGWSAFGSCFCEAAETAYMWREYGDQGAGAAIQCRALDLRSQPESYAVYPMVYDDAWFKESLRRAHEYVLSREWVDRFRFEERMVIGYEYCERILTVVMCIKRECFRPESEWGALKLQSSGVYDTDETGRRYLKIPLLPEYVSSIVLGPKSAKSEAEVGALLTRTSYTGVTITKSGLSL